MRAEKTVDSANAASLPRPSRNRRKLLISIAVSVALLIFLFRDLNVSEFSSELQKIRPLNFLPGIALLVGAMWLRAVRWRYFLPPSTQVSTSVLFQATTVGFFGNSILPLRAGEIIRPWALTKWGGVPFGRGLASILIERVFDILSLLCFFVLIVMNIPDPPEVVLLGAKALGIVVFGAGAFIVVAYGFSAQMIGFVTWIAERLFPRSLSSKVVALASEFIEGLRSLSSFSRVFIAGGLSLLIWFSSGLYYLSCFWIFGEYPSLSVGIMTGVIIAFAVAAPSAPGFIGVFQAGCVVAISTIYHYPKVFALAYSIVSHITQTLILVVLGLVILNRRGLMLRDLSTSSPSEPLA